MYIILHTGKMDIVFEPGVSVPMEPGHAIGESAFSASPEAQTYDIVAVEDSEVLTLSRDGFMEALRESKVSIVHTRALSHWRERRVH